MRNLIFLFREFLGSISQSKFLHFTYGLQVTISLLVLGIFFVLLIGAAVVWGRLGDEMKIHVFLDDDLPALENAVLEAAILDIPNVKSAKYRSKQEAMAVFKEASAIPLDDLLTENPLPASYIVQPDQPGNLEEIASQIEALSGVWIVKYNSQIVDRYLKVLLVMAAICIVTISLLLIFTYSSISNIIGISIYSRRTEIRIMQLVGATAWFIRWPFLFEGAFFGVVGAAVALLIIWGLLGLLSQLLRLSQMELALPGLGVDAQMLFLVLAAILLFLGLVIGLAGSLKIVNSILGKETRIKLDALKVKQLMK